MEAVLVILTLDSAPVAGLWASVPCYDEIQAAEAILTHGVPSIWDTEFAEYPLGVADIARVEPGEITTEPCSIDTIPVAFTGQ